MSENKLFQDWWKSESMENRVAADYEAWIEAGNECMDYMDIIQFQKDIAEVAWQAARRWIPVGEDLPDESIPVWAYLPDVGQPVVMSLEEVGEGELAWCNAQHLFWYDKELKTWACDPDFDDDYKPTHWQPLPEPPEDV